MVVVEADVVVVLFFVVVVKVVGAFGVAVVEVLLISALNKVSSF